MVHAGVQAIADPRRREILRLVRDEELSAGAIAAGFGDVTRPAISQHLQVLLRAGLLAERRDGTRRLYRARPEGVSELRDYLEQFWDTRLDALRHEAERTADAGERPPIASTTRQGVIRWRLHLAATPQAVYEMLATDAGRARFWAESTEETADGLVWHLLNQPKRVDGKVLERVPNRRIQFQYFAGSTALFLIEPDGAGGTDLTLEADNVDPRYLGEMTAGWVTVLLTLKAATDFGVDLRNHDPDRTWDQGFVDD